MWLEVLINNYPNYKNIIIDKKYLSQLPCNKTVIDTFSTILHDEVEVNKDDENMKDKAIINKVIIDEVMIDKIIINKAMVQKATI